MDGRLLLIPFHCDLRVGPRGAEEHNSEVHQEPVVMSSRSGLDGEWLWARRWWMALRIQEAKQAGAGEGVEMGAGGEGGGQASDWGDWRGRAAS